MNRKLDFRPGVVWVGGDAFVQIVDVKLKGSTSDLTLELKALNKSGSILAKIEYEVYFYDSVETKLQEEPYRITGEDVEIKPNEIGVVSKFNLSKSFPNARRAEVKLLKAVFLDGKSIDLVYEHMEKFAIPPISDDDLQLLQKVAGQDAICLPAKLSINWRCVCGYFNGDESDFCSNCMREQNQVFSDYRSIEKIKEMIEREIAGSVEDDESDPLADLEAELGLDTGPVVQEENQESVIEEEQTIPEKKEIEAVKVSAFKETGEYLAKAPKLNLASLLISGIMLSASIFILLFRMR
ncbi:hypothetical protein HMPREF9630_01559 [Peptoanaerobacter stomatis]|jgi:exported protein of unknown function|uniref:Uncharacterized protein n=1 Tax=Peptoanaerobacter stomatis TaxID=796937 RepID=J4W0P6_9FIRM|nr:hypothetical protein [Peptoanaerobacter stomatis]EHL17693.1 hypothetical protein HMPREF9630_01559 [Peptoanaerobacter stomatis]EJU19891.1 hypothetical protein HMPREF1143_1551 [Peptoanaerobacter stomatis]NWO25095.1 hypothetical protein [Peptostreptococcaceae bacterium oral taxon 081]